MREVDLEVGHVMDDECAIPLVLRRNLRHCDIVARFRNRYESISRIAIRGDRFMSHRRTVASLLRGR
jgi:hypothetical protein